MDAIIGLFGLVAAFWGGWYVRGVRVEHYDATLLAQRIGETELRIVALVDEVAELAPPWSRPG